MNSIQKITARVITPRVLADSRAATFEKDQTVAEYYLSKEGLWLCQFTLPIADLTQGSIMAFLLGSEKHNLELVSAYSCAHDPMYNRVLSCYRPKQPSFYMLDSMYIGSTLKCVASVSRLIESRTNSKATGEPIIIQAKANCVVEPIFLGFSLYEVALSGTVLNCCQEF